MDDTSWWTPLKQLSRHGDSVQSHNTVLLKIISQGFQQCISCMIRYCCASLKDIAMSNFDIAPPSNFINCASLVEETCHPILGNIQLSGTNIKLCKTLQTQASHWHISKLSLVILEMYSWITHLLYLSFNYHCLMVEKYYITLLTHKLINSLLCRMHRLRKRGLL